MKNLLNLLARIGLMLLLLVDRTPNLGVLANATYADLNIKINKFQVTGDYHIDNTWAIDKSVNKPTLSLPIGTSQNVTTRHTGFQVFQRGHRFGTCQMQLMLLGNHFRRQIRRDRRDSHGC